jgi:aromatic ring-opening dioxygenase LigB subunit
MVISVKTNNMNMLIFFALDLIAPPKNCSSERKCVSLNILKILNNRNALKTRNGAVPAKNMLK